MNLDPLPVRTWRPRNKTEARAAWRATEFFHRYLRLSHGRGTEWTTGSRFDLLPWQAEQIVRPLFGRLRPDGLRQYRGGWFEVGKKSGKSELAAGIGLKCLLADDEPMAEVYIGASDRDQAGEIFSAAAQMVRMDPRLRKRCRVLKSTKRILVVEGKQEGSWLEALAADADSADGKSPSCLIFDEVHRYKGRDFYDTLIRSTASRLQPIVLRLTTAGYDQETLGWTEHEYARQVLEGIIDDPELLVIIYAAAAGADVQDPQAWRAANPSIGHTVPVSYFEAEARKAAEDPSNENSFRRFHLNQWTSQVERWMPMDRWDASAGRLAGLVDELTRVRCWAGLDLSQTRDLTALTIVGAREEAAPDYRVLLRCWIPEENVERASKRDGVRYDLWIQEGWLQTTPGNTIDYGTIERAVRADAMRFPLQEIAFDPTYAWQMAQQLTAAGLVMVPIRQGFETMAGPTADLLQLVKERRFVHGGNPILRWAADNTVVEQDSLGRWRPSKRKAKKRIDPIVAAIMGLDRAERALFGPPPETEEEAVLVFGDQVEIGPHI